VDRPEQRQVILVVPGGHGFALLGQGSDAALLLRRRRIRSPGRRTAAKCTDGGRSREIGLDSGLEI
jgi:hypothetical protein